MTWLVWRQYRINALVTAALTAALVVLLIVTGIRMRTDYHTALSACASNRDCGSLRLFQGSGYSAVSVIAALTITVPGLLGLFWGAPLVATEFEQGTHQFIWTQGVTRGRWLAAKASWVLLAAAVWGGAVAAAVTWWSGTNNAINQDRFYSALKFGTQGIVPVAYSIFAVALGIAAGAVFRRILPALGTTLASFAALLVVLQTVARPHYLPAVTKTLPLGRVSIPGSSWILAGNITSPSQAVVGFIGNGSGNWAIQGTMPASCMAVAHNQTSAWSCLSAHGYRAVLTYQPGSRYWAFQGIESGIFLILAAALVALTIRLIIRRDA
jgi:hypothetical protein